MTDVSNPTRVPGLRGRLPQKVGDARFAIKYLHEYDPEVAPEAAVIYPVDVSQGIVDWLMLGNGPDPTLTIETPNGKGGPVGDCYFAAEAHDTMLAGATPTANGVVGTYLVYDHDQDLGVVIADALLWQFRRGNLRAFVPVHPKAVAQTMAKYQRGILEGVNLTDDADQRFTDHLPLSVAQGQKPDPDDGHVVYRIVCFADGSVTFATWGADEDAEAEWVEACSEEWWLALTAEDEAKMGAAAFAALMADLGVLPVDERPSVAGNGAGPADPPAPPVIKTPPPPSPIVELEDSFAKLLDDVEAILENGSISHFLSNLRQLVKRLVALVRAEQAKPGHASYDPSLGDSPGPQ